MKKEVSPIVAAIGILVLLVGVQVVYWKKLAPEPGTPPPAGAQSRGGGGRGTPPAGQPGFVVATLAGDPQPGYLDGPARGARFNGPAAVAVDAAGTVYVADSRNHAIRKIAPDGTVSTMAGAPGTNAFGGYADGPAKSARFSAPAGLALLPDGSLVVADTGNHRLRRIASDGAVTTLAGSDTPKDELGRQVGGYRDGPAGQAQFRYPVGVSVDGAGVIYVADAGNRCVRRLADGVVSTVPPTGAMKSPTEVAATSSSLLVSDTGGGALWSGPTSGPLEPVSKKGLGAPAGLAGGIVPASSDGRSGLPYYLDAGTHCLYDGQGSLVVGQQGVAGYADGGGDVARFATPAGMAVGRGGVLYIADFGNNCIRTVTVGSRRQEGR